MKSLKKFLFNNHKLNFGFFFLLTFFFFTILALLLLQYETFIYQKYTALYKTQTIQHLSYDAGQILKSDISDASKMNFLYSLSDVYLQDSNIKEIWVTDNELRLFFSTDPNLMQNFKAQKLPVFYYPLYAKNFVLKENHFLPNINHSIDKHNTYIVLPIRMKNSDSFQYTIGLKIRKKHFYMEKNPVVLFPSINFSLPFGKTAKKTQTTPLIWNYSIWILYLIFILISLLLATICTYFFVHLYKTITNNIFAITDKIKNLEEYTDVNEIKLEETDNTLFKNFVITLNNLIQHILFKKNEEWEQHEKKEISTEKNRILFNVRTTLFSKSSAPLHGFEQGLFYSNKFMQTHFVTQIRNLDSFKSLFLISETKQPEADTLLAEYNYLYQSFNGSNDIQKVCTNLNKKIFSLSNSQLSGVAGLIDTTTNILHLYPSGIPSILYYKASANTITSEFAKDPLFGVTTHDDYQFKLKEEKIKMSTDDIVLVFNEDILSDQLTLPDLKQKLMDNAANSPDSMINYITDFIKSKNRENIFLFILKKK